MTIFQPLTQGLFDPRLQLEAEAREYRAYPGKTCLGTPNIHADIVQAIAAIDRLAGQLRQPPTH
ncbi:hypothetical protein [Pseudomonas sp.]|uniref:hypothetical protein n=1 Tax=Pseudomonas sp. TaxID=306 RepID=UPI004054183D